MDVIKRARKKLNDMSLMKKMTLAYTLIILIPIILFGITSYSQSERYVREKVANLSFNIVAQIKGRVGEDILLARKISESIVYNNDILVLLERPFNKVVLESYNKKLVQTLQNAALFNRGGIVNISISSSNPTLPEAWPYVYSDKDIRDSKWYQDFLEDERDSLWLYPEKPSRKESLCGINGPMFRFVKKIYSIKGKYLGVLMVNFQEDKILKSILTPRNTEGEIFVFNADAGVLSSTVKYISQQEQMLFRDNIKRTSGFFTDGPFYYYYESMDPLNLFVISRISMKDFRKQMPDQYQGIILTIVLSVVFLVILAYLISILIFAKLREIMGVMNKVATGNLNIRVPVDRNDETGQIARDFNILIDKINTLIEDLVRKERAQEEARLMALQYQINPHFIYNTIEIFGMRMELQGDYEAAEAIADFGRILRYNMNHEYKHATLKEEIDHVKNYVSIEKIKYGDKIDLEVKALPEVMGYKTIKFILQPLVENSIKHGMRRDGSILHIKIDISIKDRHLYINIEDDGIGIDRETVERLNNGLKNPGTVDPNTVGRRGIGLFNINDRICLFYGKKHFVRIESTEGQYTRVVIRLPQDIGWRDSGVQGTGS